MMASVSALQRSPTNPSGPNTGKRRVRKVLIVDDHPIVRQGLRRIMENEEDLSVCGEAETARLSSPIGLDIGARTPEETAVSIIAEIIARRWGGGGRPLAELATRIHHDTAENDALNSIDVR